MTDASPSDPLAPRLELARAEAAAVRARAAPPTPDDLAATAASAPLVDLFLGDVSDALRQVCVAGLSFPDPELPEALERLAARARDHGFATAVELLLGLRVYLVAVLGEPSLEARHVHARAAWQMTQRLISWHRLLRSEHDLLTVQSRLAAEASGAAQRPQDQSFRTRSISAWPLGFELAASGKLLVFCRALGEDLTVVLADHLADWSPGDPLAGAAISRLFQDVVELPKLLASVVRLDEHPVAEQAGTLVFRPAFRSTPKLLAVTERFAPPALPRFSFAARDPEPRGPGLLAVVVSRASGRLEATYGEADRKLHLAPLLRLNLTKLLVRERALRLELDLTVLADGDELRVLGARTDFDGRVFPAQDPSLFRLALPALLARIDRVTVPGDALAQAFLRTAAHALAPIDPKRTAALLQELEALAPRGLEDTYRLGLARALLGASPEASCVSVAREALLLLLPPGAGGPDRAALARVLGRNEAEVGDGDLRLLGGAAAYRAAWLALEAGLVDELRPLLTEVYEARFRGELRGPTVGDVCARALLMVLIDLDPAAEAPDSEDDDEEDDEGEGPLDADAPETKAALEFLEAHLATLAPKKATMKTPPLPEAIELLQLADTHALLTGRDRKTAPLVQLGFPVDKLRQHTADALFELLVASPEKASVLVATGAADALLLARAAAFAGALVTP